MANITTYQKRNTPYWLNFIYAGQMYSWTYKFTVNFGQYGYIILKTGSKICHLVARDFSLYGGGMIVKFFEGAIYSGGTLRPNYSLDRRSSKTSSTLIYSSPTMTSNGTMIDQIYLGETVAYSYPAVFSSGLSEIVLKPNTNYVFECYNNSDSRNDTLQLTLLFYESGN